VPARYRLDENRRVGYPPDAARDARHRLGAKPLKVASRQAAPLRELPVRSVPPEIGIENCPSQPRSVRLVIRQRAANDPLQRGDGIRLAGGKTERVHDRQRRKRSRLMRAVQQRDDLALHPTL
jgi:hypothetical protein